MKQKQWHIYSESSFTERSNSTFYFVSQLICFVYVKKSSAAYLLQNRKLSASTPVETKRKQDEAELALEREEICYLRCELRRIWRDCCCQRLHWTSDCRCDLRFELRLSLRALSNLSFQTLFSRNKEIEAALMIGHMYLKPKMRCCLTLLWGVTPRHVRLAWKNRMPPQIHHGLSLAYDLISFLTMVSPIQVLHCNYIAMW